MRFTSKSYTNEREILLYPQPFVAITETIAKGTGVDENGRKIVKAGTVIPKNDATAIGVLLSDTDTTDGDVEVSLVIEGYLNENRLPAPISAEALAVLKEIKVRK